MQSTRTVLESGGKYFYARTDMFLLWVQPAAYMALHVVCTALTFAVCKIWWNYYHAHCFFLMTILCISAWNGASYYFEVFAHRYVSSVGLPAKPAKTAA